MKINQKSISSINDIDFHNLKFGETFTDHMLICKYRDGRWGEANIAPPLASIANAIDQALGIRMYNLPMNPQSVLSEINKQNNNQ